MNGLKHSHIIRRWDRLFLIISLCGLLAGIGVGCSKASRHARHIQKADSYFETGQFEKAEIEYLNAFRLDAKDPRPVQRLGAIYHGQGRLRAAFMFLSKAKEVAPDDLDGRTKLAAVLTSSGQLSKAREELLSILAKDPAQSDAVHFLAETALTPAEIKETRETIQKLRQQGGERAAFHVADGLLDLRQTNYISAEQAFNRARIMDPKIASAYLGLGAVYWQNNDLVRAEQMFKSAADLSPPRSLRQLPWIDFKIKTGGEKEVQTYLEQFTKKTPDFIPTLNRLAELQFDAGKTNECEVHVTKVLSLDPENFEARALLGRLKLAQRKPAEAIQEFERLKDLYPGLAQAHHLLAGAYLANRDTTKAIAALEQAVKLNANMYDPTMLLAELKIRTGDAVGGSRLLSDVVRKRPDDQRARYLLGNAYQAGGLLDEALNVYRDLARRSPTNFQAVLSIGTVLRQQNKPAEARKAFENAVALAPGSSVAINQLVELDLAEKNTVSALQRVQAAAKQNPTSTSLHFLEGKVLLAMGDTTKAEMSLRKSLELAPDFQDAYVALADLLIKTKKPEQALEEFDKALAKNPKDTGTLMMKGVIQESKGEYTKARDTYEKLLAIDPKFTLALNNLAYVYSVRLKQPDKGLELARKARQLLPEDPAVADTLGWATYLRGDYAAALPLLQESAAKLYTEPEAQYHLGMAHYMMGHEEPARTALQRAVQSANEFPGKDEARQKLIVLGGQAGLPVPEVIKSLEKSLEQSPNDAALLMRLGELYEQVGSLDKARVVAEQAVKLNPKAARALLVLARVHGARPDGAVRALEYARNARATAPDDTAVAYAAGRAIFQAGQYEWAYSILQESHRKQAGNPEAAYDFGWSAYSMGKVAEAEVALLAALRGGTNFSRAEPAKRLLEFITLSRDPARSAQASPRIQEVLKADPNYVPALMAAALAWEQSNGYAEARKLYEQVLGRYPQFLPATRNLAVLYANHLDDVQKGYDLGVKARQAFPDDAALTQALGKLAYRRGDYPYAAQLLKEVQQRKAADAQTYFYLGLCQAQLEQKMESTASLRQALTMNLEPKLAAEANRVLAESK